MAGYNLNSFTLSAAHDAEGEDSGRTARMSGFLNIEGTDVKVDTSVSSDDSYDDMRLFPRQPNEAEFVWVRRPFEMMEESDDDDDEDSDGVSAVFVSYSLTFPTSNVDGSQPLPIPTLCPPPLARMNPNTSCRIATLFTGITRIMTRNPPRPRSRPRLPLTTIATNPPRIQTWRNMKVSQLFLSSILTTALIIPLVETEDDAQEEITLSIGAMFLRWLRMASRSLSG